MKRYKFNIESRISALNDRLKKLNIDMLLTIKNFDNLYPKAMDLIDNKIAEVKAQKDAEIKEYNEFKKHMNLSMNEYDKVSMKNKLIQTHIQLKEEKEKLLKAQEEQKQLLSLKNDDKQEEVKETYASYMMKMIEKKRKELGISNFDDRKKK